MKELCYKNKRRWEKAIKSKMDSSAKSGTRSLVSLRNDKGAMPYKWVYKLKVTPHDVVPMYRLIVKDF